MKTDLAFYTVTPRIVRAFTQAEITIRPLFSHVAFEAGKAYQARLIPVEGTAGQMSRADVTAQTVQSDGGRLVIPCAFEREQEYLLSIEDGARLVAEFRLFALEDDLFTRKPYKGDFHMHTSYSDGKESPAYVAGSCRRIGMDFMAITDHRQYAPSLEAMQAFQDAPIDLRIYPGEEVHPPDNPVHILNFGGSFSINALFASDVYWNEVRALAGQITGLPSGVDPYALASCLWCYDKIRQAQGLGVFCHPYWFSRHSYDVPTALTDLLFERQPYDALELIGGYHPFELESNVLQVARYHDERAKGRRIPIVGVSDAHGCEDKDLFGWYYTIAFSPSTDLEDLIGSIKDLYSVAVEALPGEIARAFGPFRLVRYAQYLMRELFPLHDALCQEEGRLMLAYAAGDLSAAKNLAALSGRTKKLYDQLWGR